MITYSIGLKNKFRGITVREGMLFEGPAGWAEWSPFLDYDDATCVPWLRAAREAAVDGWPAPVRDVVPVNCTVPAVSPSKAAEIVRASGCGTAKVKVAEPGQTLADDLARVEAVRDAIGAGRVRIDANGAWSVDEAVKNLKELARFDLEYVEQPCAAVEELAEVRRRTDVLVLKVAPLRGVRPALAIAAECGLPVVVSSALDTSVGIAAGVALAAALPGLPYACGLATTSLMGGDVVTASLDGHGGFLRPGSVEPDPELLERYAAPADRQDWWLARLARCTELVAADSSA